MRHLLVDNGECSRHPYIYLCAAHVYKKMQICRIQF
uniref:Uncharacterized protein n=1 Tax=Siphoviridae sp. ctrpM6 TaxID=2827956 RepID=A0A8S5T4W9_9CAUD|nr:MAG TPA: hypothetical protein [Siphoviridae sp. ctrpM6]